MEHARFSSPKKRRVEDFEQDYGTIVQSPDVWLSDGNMIIQAETVQFRVRSSELDEYRCKLFYDRYIANRVKLDVSAGMPLPVIYIPEKAQEWKDMLMSVYGKHRPGWIEMDRIMSLLRVAIKYEVRVARNMATWQLRTIIPCTDIHSWDENDLSELGFRSDYTNGVEFYMVNSALEAGLQTILPVMYFLCIRDQGPNKIIAGQHRKNGEFVGLSQTTQRMLLSAIPTLSQLGMEHTELTPRRLLQDAHVTGTVQCEAPEGSPRCSQRCVEMDQWVLRMVREPGLALCRVREETAARCEPCHRFVKDRIFEGREKLWEELPAVFGLLPWKEMADYQDNLEDLGLADY